MRRKGFGLPLFLALLASLFIAPSALSLYLVNQALGSVDFDIPKGNERAVAVIGSDMSTYYASVEGALRAATSKISSGEGDQTVYVLPGISNDSNPIVIDKDCTVSSGVTLSLPYAQSGDTFTTGFEGGSISELYASGESDFGDSTLDNKKTNQQTLVVLGEGKTMTIEAGGSLVIGGQLGTAGAGQLAFGMTYGNYAELAMDAGSSIDCLGSIDVRGYIKPWDEGENDSCLIRIGNEGGGAANLSIPLVFYDFPGGSAGLAGSAGQVQMGNWNGSIVSGVFPFEMYDLPNLAVPFRTYYGSTIDCSYAFVMSDIVIGGNLNLLGDSNSIITLEESGSFLKVDYTPAVTYTTKDALANGDAQPVSRGLTVNDPMILQQTNPTWPSGTKTNPVSVADGGMARTKLQISGRGRTNELTVAFQITYQGLEIALDVSTLGGTLSIPVVGWIVGEKDYPALAFPFSYKWDIEILPGAMVSVQNRVKFLPGASLRIQEGGTLDISKEVAGVTIDAEGGQKISNHYPKKDWSKDEQGTVTRAPLDSPAIVNNGAIVVRQGGSLGATILTEREGATVNFDGGATSSNTFVGTYEIGFKTTDGVYGPVNFSAEAYIGTSGDDCALTSFSGQGESFTSWAGGPSGHYFRPTMSTLAISTNGVTGVELLVDDVSTPYEDGNSLELRKGSIVRFRFNYSALREVRLNLDGSPLDLVSEGNGYLYGEFSLGAGSHRVDIYKAEPVSISAANARIGKEHKAFSITWKIKNLAGIDVDSGKCEVDRSENLDYTLFSSVKTVYPGWIFTVSTSDVAAGDNASVSSISSSGGGSANGSTYTFSSSDNNATLTVNVGYSGCIVEGTLVDMADGTSKKVEDLEVGDMVMAFDHETGEEVASPILCVDVEPEGEYLVSDLLFSDGTSIGIAFEHGFFDRTLNRYVYLTPENAEEYIGHEFYSLGGEGLVLEGVETSRKEVALYSPVTAYTMNLFHEGLLGMPGGVEGFFNVFEYGEDMAYDPVKKAEDIAKYGLYTYEDVSGLISREAFDLLPIPYLKVAVGKGIIAWEDIVRMARMFADLLPQ